MCPIVAHHVMGMGFSVIVQPDQLGAEPPSVEYCDNHGLVASNTTGTNLTSPNADASSNNGTGSSGSNQMNPFKEWFVPTVIVLFISSIM